MRKKDIKGIEDFINDVLAEIDSEVGNPAYCYDKLAADMAKAAALVYDACMAGQKFAEKQR